MWIEVGENRIHLIPLSYKRTDWLISLLLHRLVSEIINVKLKCVKNEVIECGLH
jgi:hypothetical protein